MRTLNVKYGMLKKEQRNGNMYNCSLGFEMKSKEILILYTQATFSLSIFENK